MSLAGPRPSVGRFWLFENSNQYRTDLAELGDASRRARLLRSKKKCTISEQSTKMDAVTIFGMTWIHIN